MKVDAPDFGLFGPGSMAWRIHSHPSGWVGGIRALLLQALEPRAMAGVAQFSEYLDDAWQRFSATSDFVMTVTYRPRVDAEAAIARVRKIHEPIVGTDPYTNTHFEANDPYLLAYIHNCLVDSLLCAYVNCGGRMSMVEQDSYVEEMCVLADLIGANVNEVPRTARGVSQWLSSRRELVATKEAKLAAETIRNINLPTPFLPPWHLAWNAAIATMPDYALELYGFNMNESYAILSRSIACVAAQSLRVLLPSHPYAREAKYSYYEYYSRASGSGCAVKLERLLADISTLGVARH